jgi:hypothetical protein
VVSGGAGEGVGAVSREPRVGDHVRVPWGFGDAPLLVVAVSGHGTRAHVTVEVPVEDADGTVVDRMTVTYRVEDLDAA